MCTHKLLTLAFSFPKCYKKLNLLAQKSQKLVKESLVNIFKVSLITNFSVLQNASASAKLHAHTVEHQVNAKPCFPHIKDHNTDQMVYAQLN